MILRLDPFLASLANLGRSLDRLGHALAREVGERPRIRRWSAAELRQVRKRYAHERSDAIALDLGRPVHQVYQTAARLGLHKSKAYLKSGLPDINKKANGGCFLKGLTPWNKGKKLGPARGRSALTTFKKGQRPHTWRPIGTLRVTDGYVYKKIYEGREPVRRNWEMVHILLWRQHHGKIPRGHIVVFRNKDRKDIRIENLELITKAENMRRNTIHNLPEPVKDLIRMTGILKRAINKRNKNEDDQRPA